MAKMRSDYISIESFNLPDHCCLLPGEIQEDQELARARRTGADTTTMRRAEEMRKRNSKTPQVKIPAEGIMGFHLQSWEIKMKVKS